MVKDAAWFFCNDTATTEISTLSLHAALLVSLRAIPYGETRSYGQIAAAIGKPKAGRAVARACATNQVSLVVPCHRVIGANGALAGYRWGVARKKKLLKKEQAGPKT